MQANADDSVDLVIGPSTEGCGVDLDSDTGQTSVTRDTPLRRRRCILGQGVQYARRWNWLIDPFNNTRRPN